MNVEARWPGVSSVFLSFILRWFLPQRAGAASPAVSAANPAAVSATAAPATNSESDETLYLEVEINDRSIGKVGEFIFRRGRLLSHPDELRGLGLRVPVSRASETGGLVSLSDLPGLSWTLDEKDQLLQLTAGDSALLPTRCRHSAKNRPAIGA